MPVKVNSVGRISTHKTKKSLLFKKTNIQKSDNVVYRGNNVMKDSSFHPVHSLVLDIMDKISPFFNKHRKIGSVMMKLSERILKNADSLK